ncbi:MAG: hypothetical protein IJL25_05035 [Clostridia bacterium]|nr:hypothetical protein [Clostridia bacterium]
MLSVTSASNAVTPDFMSYIVSILCALISGIITYFVARRQSKTDIQKLEKQFEYDLEKEREKFVMEKEKMEIEHKHQIDLLQKEAGNKLSSELLGEVLKLPEVRQQVSQGMRNANKNKKIRGKS